MIAAWEMHRSGELEEFAHRLAEMGKGLTLHTFSETRLAFLRDTLESVNDSEVRIGLRLKIAAVLMDLARWEECEKQQRLALAEATTLANATLVARASNELATLLYHTNRFGEAEPLMRRALEIDEATLGRATPVRGERFEQPSDSATGHQPDRGSRDANAAVSRHLRHLSPPDRATSTRTSNR